MVLITIVTGPPVPGYDGCWYIIDCLRQLVAFAPKVIIAKYSAPLYPVLRPDAGALGVL